jgi:hypothetical protein
MDAISLLRILMDEAHSLLESTVGDVTSDQLHYVPEGRALPVGAAYAHVIFSEDILIQLLKGQAPLFEAGTPTGASVPMPNFMKGWEDYAGWTKQVRFDLVQLRAYAKAVYANTDAYLATLTEADLDKPDPFGQKSLGYFVGRWLLGHVDNLAGEISAAKGLQGLQGYPEA